MVKHCKYYIFATIAVVKIACLRVAIQQISLMRKTLKHLDRLTEKRRQRN